MKDLTDIEKQILRKKNLLQKKRNELISLMEQCPHTHIIEREDYVPGTYYDRAYTEYSTLCSVCGKTTFKSVKTHSWHG